MSDQAKAAEAAPEADPAIEAISGALAKHNCKVDGFLVLNESICKGVPEIKPLPQVGESEEDHKKRAEDCKSSVDKLMDEFSKEWRVTAAVLNGASRIQIDIIDKAEGVVAPSPDSAADPKPDKKEKKA